MSLIALRVDLVGSGLTHVRDYALAALTLAQRLGVTILFFYQDVELHAHPTDTVDSIERDYSTHRMLGLRSMLDGANPAP